MGAKDQTSPSFNGGSCGFSAVVFSVFPPCFYGASVACIAMRISEELCVYLFFSSSFSFFLPMEFDVIFVTPVATFYCIMVL